MPSALAWPYTFTWMALCVAAGLLIARSPASFTFTQRAYWRFVLAPWKLGMFLLALGFFVVAAPYTGDPTWDRWVGSGMATMTYATAPWAVGALFRTVRDRGPWTQAYVAGCLWMLSAAWGYDFYNWRRLGFYPGTWAVNIVASSVLYVCAGLCWNLTHREGVGVTFGFLLPEWPDLRDGAGALRLVGYVLVFAALVGAMLLPFVIR